MPAACHQPVIVTISSERLKPTYRIGYGARHVASARQRPEGVHHIRHCWHVVGANRRNVSVPNGTRRFQPERCEGQKSGEPHGKTRRVTLCVSSRFFRARVRDPSAFHDWVANSEWWHFSGGAFYIRAPEPGTGARRRGANPSTPWAYDGYSSSPSIVGSVRAPFVA